MNDIKDTDELTNLSKIEGLDLEGNLSKIVDTESSDVAISAHNPTIYDSWVHSWEAYKKLRRKQSIKLTKMAIIECLASISIYLFSWWFWDIYVIQWFYYPINNGTIITHQFSINGGLAILTLTLIACACVLLVDSIRKIYTVFKLNKHIVRAETQE